MISGYLAIISLEKYGYFKLLVNKAKRLIWPLFWVNLLFIVLITYPTQAIDPNVRTDLKIYPFNLLGWFQATFAFYRLPANQPLFFLKDLYTCFLLIPILFYLAKIKYINLLLIVWMAYKCIYLKTVFVLPVFPTIFFRFDIVFAFYLGILLFHYQNLYFQGQCYCHRRRISNGVKSFRLLLVSNPSYLFWLCSTDSDFTFTTNPESSCLALPFATSPIILP